jgi:hypothetical protein
VCTRRGWGFGLGFEFVEKLKLLFAGKVCLEKASSMTVDIMSSPLGPPVMSQNNKQGMDF